MEAIKTRIKTIAWFLTSLMLFQSCVVYHKTPTTLERASHERIRTKVTNTDGETFKYRYIAYEEDAYIGYFEEELGEFTRVPIDTADILGVRTKNKSASVLVTILAIAVPVIVMVAISFDGVSLKD